MRHTPIFSIGQEDGRAVLGKADVHVGDVQREGARHAPASPVLVHPPEDDVLEVVVVRDAEREQARHVRQSRLEVFGVVRREAAVVDAQAPQTRACDPGEEERLFGLEYDVVVPDEALQGSADAGEEDDADSAAAGDGEALQFVAEAREEGVRELEPVAVEREALQVAQGGQLAQQVRADRELAVPQVQGDDLVFRRLEEMLQAVREARAVEKGVRDVQLPGPADAQAVEDEIEDLRGAGEVAAAREHLQVDGEAVDALEAGSGALQGAEVCRVQAGEVARRVRREHDDVPAAHVQVEAEAAGGEVHVLDEVLAHAREPEQGAPVALKYVAREDEEHDVEEELREVRQGVRVSVAHGVDHARNSRHVHPKKRGAKKRKTWRKMLTKVPAFAAYCAEKPQQAAASKPVAAANARSEEVVLQTMQEEDEDYVLL